MSSPIKRLPKWLDRAGFEADKMMRANRVRSEASKLRDQADDRTHALGVKVLELAGAGMELEPELREIVDEILSFHADAARKDEEAKAINSEQWVEAAPPPAPAPSPATAPQRVPTGPTDPIAQRLHSYIESKNAGTFNCPKCGSVIRSNATFCPRCGRKVLR